MAKKVAAGDGNVAEADPHTPSVPVESQAEHTASQKSSNLARRPVQRINLDFTIYQHIQAGSWPAKICKQLKLKKSAVSYHIASLMERGLIEFVAQGVWKVKADYAPKQFKRVSRVAESQLPLSSNLNSFKPNTDRAHAYQFKLQLRPDLRNWKDREAILQRLGIDYKPLGHLFGGGQGITFKGRKIHLTDNSIIVYELASYFAEKARLANARAMADVLKVIKALERELHADFSFSAGFYKLRITRQHHALIKNALAGIYTKKGQKKLEVYNERGLWLLIDNSWNFEELECVDSETAVPDNEGMQGWANSMQRTGYKVTPEFVLDAFAQVADNQKRVGETMVYLDQNIKSHFEVLNGIKDAIRELKEEYKKRNSDVD